MTDSHLSSNLAARGVRLTGPRRAVLLALESGDGHLSAEELVERLPAIGRATVYRTIKLLLKEGLICRVIRDDGVPFYRASPPRHHHHLVCTRCGAARDFAECDVSGLAERLAGRTGFVIERHWLEIYGVCPRCRAA